MHRPDLQNPLEHMLRKRSAETDVDEAVKALVRIVEFILLIRRNEKTLFRSHLIFLFSAVWLFVDEADLSALGVLENMERPPADDPQKQIRRLVVPLSRLNPPVARSRYRRGIHIAAFVFPPEINPDILSVTVVKIDLLHETSLFTVL